jgi:hypothetical protein
VPLLAKVKLKRVTKTQIEAKVQLKQIKSHTFISSGVSPSSTCVLFVFVQCNLLRYAVRGDTRTSSATRLLFCTVGVLLRRLHDDPSLAGVSVFVAY